MRVGAEDRCSMSSAWLGAFLKYRAIDHNTPFKTSDGRAVLHWCDLKSHFVPRLERSLAPACGILSNCTLRFYNPMQRVATVILRVNLEEHVGVGPNIVSHRSFKHDRFCRVVGSVPVMCE